MAGKVSPVEALPRRRVRTVGWSTRATSPAGDGGRPGTLHRLLIVLRDLQSENDVPLGMWSNRIDTVGEAPTPRVLVNGRLRDGLEPLACQHCENPACPKVCPVQATYPREDGLVMQDPQRCIGCRFSWWRARTGARVQLSGRTDRPTSIRVWWSRGPSGRWRSALFVCIGSPRGRFRRAYGRAPPRRASSAIRRSRQPREPAHPRAWRRAAA